MKAVVFCLVALCAWSQPTKAAPALPTHAVLLRFPSGTYLENLAVRRDGAVLFTSYFDKTIELWDGRGGTVFATLPDYPVNVIELPNGQVLVLAHRRKFTEGPAALAGANRLYWLNRAGGVVRTLETPDLVFGNGMITDGARGLLVTDAAAGVIWRVDLATGASKIWFDAPLLKPNPTQPKGKLGVNGLKRDGDTVLFSNSATRSLYRLAVRRGQPWGLPEKVIEAPGADDLAVGRGGRIYLATHRETVLAIAKGTEPAVIADQDVAGSTSVALSRDRRTLYVLGTGGFFEGKTDPATLVRIPLPR